MRSVAASVASAVLVPLLLAAQEPAFDVASVRPNLTAVTPELRALPTGRLIATNVPARSLIQRAYKLHEAQIVGAPDWVATERFDIDARTAAPPAGGPGAVYPRLRPLLMERFRLRAHMEMREMSAYVLVHGRRDRQLGSQVRPTQADCTRGTTLSPEEIRASARDGWPPCGMGFMVSFVATQAGAEQAVQMRVRRSGTTMSELAAALQDGLDRPVVDRTGLDGRFDVEYTYAPRPPSATADSPFGAPAPMLFVAIEEQLGLKLESQRTDVPVLVIDGIERPTPN